MKQRLLERLDYLERATQQRGTSDHETKIDSLVGHLRCLLNTRRGGVPIADKYGMPDLLDLLQRYPDSVLEIESSISQAIERFEPRLERVRVTLTPQEDELLFLRFHIDAGLRHENGASVSFETIVDSHGKISFRR